MEHRNQLGTALAEQPNGSRRLLGRVRQLRDCCGHLLECLLWRKLGQITNRQPEIRERLDRRLVPRLGFAEVNAKPLDALAKRLDAHARLLGRELIRLERLGRHASALTEIVHAGHRRRGPGHERRERAGHRLDRRDEDPRQLDGLQRRDILLRPLGGIAELLQLHDASVNARRHLRGIRR